MKIRVLFKPKTPLRNKIRNAYLELYGKFKSANPNDKTYTNTKLRKNIQNVLSVGRISVDEVLLRQTVYIPWEGKGWVEIPPYCHWHFAVIKQLDKFGKPFLEIQDCIYEGDYHNDTMQTKPYNESVNRKLKIILKESQLRRIIRESIKKVLNII